VAVGGDTHHFVRLLTAVKHLKQKKKIKDDVVIQYGHSEFRCDDCKCFDFIDAEAFEKLIRKTDVIISHAGAGTILTALKYGKPVVVVPRQKKFKEHVDDHQLQLTKELAKQKKIIPVYRINGLEEAIAIAKKFRPILTANAREEIVELIGKFCER
ncbi:unnamed protein product, partial [marine sediment metagenome]